MSDDVCGLMFVEFYVNSSLGQGFDEDDKRRVKLVVVGDGAVGL